MGKRPSGLYTCRCFNRHGTLLWADTFHNTIATVGKNLMLNTAFAGAVYSVTGPFLGLISSVGYGAGPAAGDTMASHLGWVEAGSGGNFPLYNVGGFAVRATCLWNAAASGAIALTTPIVFDIVTTGGTIKGAFVVYGTGALSTIANGAGTLYSAGVFSTGDKIVNVGDAMQVSYSTSL